MKIRLFAIDKSLQPVCMTKKYAIQGQRMPSRNTMYSQQYTAPIRKKVKQLKREKLRAGNDLNEANKKVLRNKY